MTIVSPYNNKATSQANKNEVFIGNTRTDRLPRVDLKELKTFRTGEQAFDIHGKKIPKEDYVPMFIGNCEYDAYNKIMLKKMDSTTTKF